MSETYPTSPPPMHPLLSGVAHVRASQDDRQLFEVNFDTGECQCPHGSAWRWNDRKWVPNSFCVHKLKAVASLISKTEDETLYDFYERQVGFRYNPFVAVSAMHKELRRGDEKAALYWATVMLPHRGTHGVITYMRNILFEETRDVALGFYLLKLSDKGRSVTPIEMHRAIRRFCKAPKKWELPWRFDIFLDEMRGYQQLAKDYGYEVAKAKDIIPEDQRGKLCKTMLQGFAEGDRVKVQYGLKGWFKSQSPDHDKMKIAILNTLIDVSDLQFPNAWHDDLDLDYAHRIYEYVMARIRSSGAPGYHELNAYADALTGETGGDPAATLPRIKHRAILASPRRYRIPLGKIRKVPLYANDNHTWHGKSLMKAYGKTELQPGAKQDHLDFRICGAYMGVAWRYLAMKQHATIDCKWGDVKWSSPTWLWKHLDAMWY